MPGHGILQGLGQGIAGQQVRSMALLITPGPECLYDGFTVLCPVGQFSLALNTLFPNNFLMAVERANQGQCLGTGGRLIFGCLLKPSAAVRPTLGVGDLAIVFGIGGIGFVAIAEQRATEVPQ